MKGVRVSLLIVFLVSLSGGYFLSPEKKVDESLYLREVAPETEFSPKKGAYYPSVEGVIAFNTYDIAPEIKGYAGPIKLLIVLGPDGKIRGIRLLEHRETPNYVHRMETPGFLGQFLGKDINDPFLVDRDIDGITRATVSVEALAKTVRESSGAAGKEFMGLAVIGKDGGSAVGGGGTAAYKWIAYIGLFAFAFAGYFITRRNKRFLRLRDVSLLLSIVIMGLWLSAPFSILHVFNLVLGRSSADPLLYALIASTALSIIAAGRFYCGWLCPFGALSEVAGRLPIRKWQVAHAVDDKWRNLKYILLGTAVGAVFIFRKPEFGNYETYVTLFSFKGNALTWALVGASLVLSLRVERFWCRYLCPVGALTGALSRKAKGYPSRHDCPMVNKPDPLISECIRCNRCYLSRPE